MDCLSLKSLIGYDVVPIGIYRCFGETCNRSSQGSIIENVDCLSSEDGKAVFSGKSVITDTAPFHRRLESSLYVTFFSYSVLSPLVSCFFITFISFIPFLVIYNYSSAFIICVFPLRSFHFHISIFVLSCIIIFYFLLYLAEYSDCATD